MIRHAKKTKLILDMEKDTPGPLSEILTPGAILERSRKALGMSGAMTIPEAMPELSVIAKRENLNLNRTSEFLEAKRIMDMAKLNRR